MRAMINKSGSEGLNQSDYLRAASVLEDRIVVLNVKDGRAEWVSEKLLKLYPQLKINLSIERVIQTLFDCQDTQERLRKHLSGGAEAWQKESIFCGDYEASICGIGNNKYLVRMSELTIREEAFSRHLEDRQRLLFASGRFSVSEMASTLAHEINQPVGTLNNLLQGIKDRMVEKSEEDQSIIWAINKSIEQTEYTSKIIARIRDYAQSKTPKIEAINIVALIDKCISLMDWEVTHTNVEIEHKKVIDTAIVQGDELMLQQVVVNLIRNGIEAIKEKKKKILVLTKQDGEYLEIAIQDNGSGLSESEEENLFLPFASNKSNGMGVGLNICRSFVELHRGRIWLTKNKDKGCTSHILLPIESRAEK